MKLKPVSHSATSVHKIIKFIREERVNQGLTQKELSSASRMSTSAVNRFECGVNPITLLYTIERMLNALGYILHVEKIK